MRVAAEGPSELLADCLSVRISNCSWSLRKKIVPDGKARSSQLRKPLGSRKEEDVQVRSSITPFRDVRSRNVREILDDPSDMDDETSELFSQ